MKAEESPSKLNTTETILASMYERLLRQSEDSP